MASTGDVPRTKSCSWAAVPLWAQLAFPFLPGIPAFARSSALPLAPKLSSPILPEAADLLGAQRLSSYAAGAGGDGCGERGAAAETKRSAPSARARRPEGSPSFTAPLGASPRSARQPGDRGTWGC